jgi:hypothetical protein
LTTSRGGGSSSSSSFFDDETTTIFDHDGTNVMRQLRVVRRVSSVPLPFSMLEGATATNDEHPSDDDDDDDDGRYKDVQTALLAVLAGCRGRAYMVQTAAWSRRHTTTLPFLLSSSSSLVER